MRKGDLRLQTLRAVMATPGQLVATRATLNGIRTALDIAQNTACALNNAVAADGAIPIGRHGAGRDFQTIRGNVDQLENLLRGLETIATRLASEAGTTLAILKAEVGSPGF